MFFCSIKSSQANINDYVDQFLVKVGAGISAAGLDPVALPDENVNVSNKEELIFLCRLPITNSRIVKPAENQLQFKC